MRHQEIKRCWFITDTHFGLRNSAQEWLQITSEYFYNFFIPLLKKEYVPGDVLVHCGDVFDSRHSLNLFAMNLALEIFEDISKILPIYVLIGNHDIAKKNSNNVNSSKILKWMPNVKVIEEPIVIISSGKRILFMPWRINSDEESACVKENPADFLFCHTDVQGLRFNRSTVIEGGIKLSELQNFRKVYSGHIHYAQQKGNFKMLGCPFPMTRSDINNEKGVWNLDLVSEQETYYPNTYSPKFVKIMFEKVLEMEEDSARELFRNNFVDILVDTKWSLNFSFSTFSEDMKGYRRLDFIPHLEAIENEDGDVMNIESEIEKIDIIELSKRLIYNTSHSDNVKEKLLSTVKTLYDRVQKSQDEKEEL